MNRCTINAIYIFFNFPTTPNNNMAGDAHSMQSATAKPEQVTLLSHRKLTSSGKSQRSSIAPLLGYGAKQTNEHGFLCMGYYFMLK